MSSLSFLLLLMLLLLFECLLFSINYLSNSSDGLASIARLAIGGAILTSYPFAFSALRDGIVEQNKNVIYYYCADICFLFTTFLPPSSFCALFLLRFLFFFLLILFLCSILSNSSGFVLTRIFIYIITFFLS